MAKDAWKDVVKGYFVGLDFTDRIYQARAKADAGPWSLSKGQDYFTGLSDFYVDVNAVSDVQDLQMRLEVNGQERQNGTTADMLFSVPELISHITKYTTLNAGDMIFTGTPHGVSQVVAGDKVHCELTDNKRNGLLLC